MIIDGIEIKKNQKLDQLTSYYFSVLNRELRSVVYRIRKLESVTIEQSKTTTTIYATYHFKGDDNLLPYKISLRNHFTSAGNSDKNYFVYEYENIDRLTKVIENDIRSIIKITQERRKTNG